MSENEKQTYLDVLEPTMKSKINKYLDSLEEYLKFQKIETNTIDELIDHTVRVINISQRFINKLREKGKNHLKEETLITAACFHDIAKYKTEKVIVPYYISLISKNNKANKLMCFHKKYITIKRKHHNNKDKVNHAIKKLHLGKNKKVCKIIECHRGKFNPTDLHREATILRIADKLDKYYKNDPKANKKCRKNVEIIIRYFVEKEDMKFCMKFLDAYFELKKEIKKDKLICAKLV